MKREIGIDLSSHNSNINVSALLAIAPNYAIIKVSEGTYYFNDQFNNLLTKCKQAKIKNLAYYHYLIADSYNSAVDEAFYCLKKLDFFKVPKGSTIFADSEISKNNTESVKGFLTTIKNAGYQVGFYTYKGMLGQFNLEGIQTVAKYTWLASYPLASGVPSNDNPNFSYFPSTPKVDIWQFTDNLLSFKVDGNISVTDISSMFSSVSHETTSTEPSSWVDKQGLKWYKEQGTFTLDRDINLRWGANTYSAIFTTLPKGSTVKYDAFAINQGYVWLRQPRTDGTYLYLVGRNKTTGEPWGVFK